MTPEQEVERLRELLASTEAQVASLIRERDEARAELERVRADLVDALVAGYDGLLHNHDCMGVHGYPCKAWCAALTPPQPAPNPARDEQGGSPAEACRAIAPAIIAVTHPPGEETPWCRLSVGHEGPHICGKDKWSSRPVPKAGHPVFDSDGTAQALRHHRLILEEHHLAELAKARTEALEDAARIAEAKHDGRCSDLCVDCRIRRAIASAIRARGGK